MMHGFEKKNPEAIIAFIMPCFGWYYRNLSGIIGLRIDKGSQHVLRYLYVLLIIIMSFLL